MTSIRELSAALGTIPVSPVTVVGLAYRATDIPRNLDGYGYLITRGEGLMTLGVLWESSLFAGRAPEGMVLLRVMMGGARSPQVSALDEQAATRVALAELQTVMGVTAAPTRVWTFPATRRDLAVHDWPSRSGRRHPAASRAASRSRPLRDVVRRRVVRVRRRQRVVTGRCAALAGCGRMSTNRRDVVLVTYGEPPTPSFIDQLVYSWRILVGLTRTVADIPMALLPIIALSRARGRNKLWTTEGYSSPLEALTHGQADQVRKALAAADPSVDWHVHVAYEFRQPTLARALASLPANSTAIVAPMYAADSSFTHALARTVADQHRAASRKPDVRVLPAIEIQPLADISAAHVLKAAKEQGAPLGPKTALVLAAHGTLLNPSKPIDTGFKATEALCAAITERLKPHFGAIVYGWLNHTRGGKWTEPPIEEALRAVAAGGYDRIVYYPYGFLADNAESELEGRIALRVHQTLAPVHLLCLNESPALADLIARQVIVATN